MGQPDLCRWLKTPRLKSATSLEKAGTTSPHGGTYLRGAYRNVAVHWRVRVHLLSGFSTADRFLRECSCFLDSAKMPPFHGSARSNVGRELVAVLYQSGRMKTSRAALSDDPAAITREPRALYVGRARRATVNQSVGQRARGIESRGITKFPWHNYVQWRAVEPIRI